jgi:trk system potassium uptake protein TrkA
MLMNIVIVGGGSVGSAICTQLALEDHNVTIVDANEDSLAEIANSCDVFCVEGNGAEISVLRKAGAENADLLIAVSPEDEINILCCAAARKLGTRHTVARVRNPEYTELMRLLQSEMNLSFTINPELAAAKEIYRLLRFPSAAKIDTFCHGRVELAEFTVAKDSPLCGLTLIDLRKKLNTKFLVCGVLRNGEAYIPAGDFRIQAGDSIGVTAPGYEIGKFFREIGVYKNPIRNVLIVGGGRTSYYLESMLREGKIRSTVIERDPALCQELSNDYKNCTVICDNGTRQETLLEAGIENADAFLALSDVDEENAIVSMYAKTKNVGKIVTMISRISYIDFFKSAGLESIVSPRSSTAAYILRYVRSMANSADSSAIESLHKIMNDKIEALELSVKDDIPELTGMPLKLLRPRAGVLIACIVRGGEVIIPGGDDLIKKGDSVIIMSTGSRINSLKDIL